MQRLVDRLWNGPREVACYRKKPFLATLKCVVRVSVAQQGGQKVMPLFQCRKCGCAEDTALCHYWSARLRETEPLCSACDLTVGKWHGEFPREPFELRHQREIERWLEFSWVQHHPDGAAQVRRLR